MSRPNAPPVKAVDTTFQILNAIMDLDGAGVTELASHVGLPKSTVSDHLLTLRRNDYVVKDDEEYRIGLRFLELGDHARDRSNIYQKSKSQINKLAEQTGMLAHLSIEEQGQGVIIYEMEGQEAISLDTYVGRQVYMHSTALGKAMLSCMDRERVERIVDTYGLPRETPQTITDRQPLFEQLKRIRERGYAVSSEERLEGLACVAAPIEIEGERDLYGAVSVCAPMAQFGNERFETEMPRLVKHAANVIELEMRYS